MDIRHRPRQTVNTDHSCTFEQESRVSNGEPRDAAINFDTYWILQRHLASCGFPARRRGYAALQPCHWSSFQWSHMHDIEWRWTAIQR